MWVGKFKIKHKCPILERTKKYDVISSGYVLSVYEEKGRKFHSVVHVVKGDEKEKKRYMNSYRNDKSITAIEFNGDQLYMTIEGEMIAQRYSKKLSYLEPVVHKGDSEVWTLGCSNRRELMNFYHMVQDIGTFKEDKAANHNTNNNSKSYKKTA